MAKKKRTKTVETITHDKASRKNIPTGELQPMMSKADEKPVELFYERRNRDLDPQLVWRGKEEQDESGLVLQAPPLFIQEKISPKVLIDDLIRRSKAEAEQKTPATGIQADLFADFNGLPNKEARTEFYQHDANWSNRMILGDSLQVMASLAEKEGLRGKVQCIYLDPPYGIKFNSNFQWSTTSRNVQDSKVEHITREPEQVKAFRDTWRDGVHSYLTYLRDRLMVARDLLTESGSIFVQIGDENVHRVRVLMDEVFGEENSVSMITYRTSSGTQQQNSVKRISDYILWYCKKKDSLKFRRLLGKRSVDTKIYNKLEFPNGVRRAMSPEEKKDPVRCPDNSKVYQKLPVHSMASGDHKPRRMFGFDYGIPLMRSWRYTIIGLERLRKASRLQADKTVLRTIYYHDDFPASEITNLWEDTGPEIYKSYVVQTSTLPIQRCLLMTTDPGDLVLDPTCGSGTTSHIAEQWGRRWITIDTSRVALALARARIMGACYPYYLLSDSRDGQIKEAEVTGKLPSEAPTYNNIRQGFVYQRVSHVTLKSISRNSEIDVIWEDFRKKLEPLRGKLNNALGEAWEEWQVPREAGKDWPKKARNLHSEWRGKCMERQKEIDASIAAKAEYDYLYEFPYEDSKKVRVAGPFTVDSLSPHYLPGVDENDKSIGHVLEARLGYGQKQGFAEIILEHLRTSGIQQTHKEERISFSSLQPWPGSRVCAAGSYLEGDQDSGVEKRAAIFIGPEFGTVSRPDLVEAAREAADANFDVLVACAFNYDAHSAELKKLGRVPVLKARMNADLHMADTLKNTGTGNLFVVFGEPDIEILNTKNGQVQIQVKGVDVFHPKTGEIRSSNADGIACWFVDTNYNGESFFVRHAYFYGASGNNPYKALKTSLKSEINREAWETLRSDISRPFDKPASGRIAVKVINCFGDEVMKVLSLKKK